jgi:hypothetical protein
MGKFISRLTLQRLMIMALRANKVARNPVEYGDRIWRLTETEIVD